jgi:hypothetical protein
VTNIEWTPIIKTPWPRLIQPSDDNGYVYLSNNHWDVTNLTLYPRNVIAEAVSGKTPLAGSVRLRSKAAKFEKAVDPTQTIHFTEVIRMPPSSPGMPDVATWLQTRPTMPKTDYRETYKAVLDTVITLFEAQGMTVVRSEAASAGSVEVPTSATQINSTITWPVRPTIAFCTDRLHPPWL